MKKKVLIIVEDKFWLDIVEGFVFELVNDGVLIRHLRRSDLRIITTENLDIEILVATGYSLVGKRADLVLNLCHFFDGKSIDPVTFHEEVAIPIMRHSRGIQ